MEINNQTEALMVISDINTPRYGFAPTAAFAATRACAERRAHQLATTAAAVTEDPSSTTSLFRRFTTRVRQSI